MSVNGCVDAADAALHRRLGEVGHPVRRPQPLQTVRLARRRGRGPWVRRPVGSSRSAHRGPSRRRACLDQFRCGSGILAVGDPLARSRRPRSSRGTPLIWLRSPNRKLTAPASTSRSPASSMNGTFWLVWLTIFLAIRSSLVSTSTRTPCDFSCAATSSRYVDVLVGDRDADHLHRRQPRRERARVVLGEHAEEPLDRAEQRAVDHHRPLPGAVGGGVLQLEAVRAC